jgi:hypothetical protein
VEQRAAPSDPRVARARVAADQLRTTLLAALETAIKEQGPARAIGVCQSIAPALAKGLSRDGVTIGRTSHKLRNEANAPKPWVEPLLKKMIALPADQRGPLTTSLPGDALGVVLPIATAKPCLACHGTAIAPEVATAISTQYPRDQAVGFSEGDLRGVFWVEVR